MIGIIGVLFIVNVRAVQDFTYYVYVKFYSITHISFVYYLSEKIKMYIIMIIPDNVPLSRICWVLSPVTVKFRTSFHVPSEGPPYVRIRTVNYRYCTVSGPERKTFLSG